MNDIVQMSKGGTNFYPQTKIQAVLGLQDSLVGTNLLVGTSSSEKAYIGDFSTFPSWANNTSSVNPYAVNAGSTYTYSIYLTKLTGSFVLGYWAYDSNKNYTNWIQSGLYSSSGKTSWTFTVPSGVSYIFPHVVHASDDFTCTAKEEKLEKGPIATDYSLNPEDISTNDSVQTAISTAIKGVTGVTPTDLSNYFTKDETVTQITSAVNSAIDKAKPDLSNYQTSTQVQTAISNAINGIKPTDLSNYATKSDVATEINSAVSNLKPEFDSSKVGEIEDNLLLKTYTPFSMTGNNTANQNQSMYSLSRRIEKGTTITLSFDAVSTASANFTIQNDGSDGGSLMSYITDTVDTTKKHYSATSTLDNFSDLDVNMRLDNIPSTTTITVSNMKLELGSNETSYSVSPKDFLSIEDVQTAITSALGKVDTSQTMNDSTRTKLQNMNKEMGS